MIIKLETEGLSETEEIKVHLARNIIESIINSDDFKNYIINFKYMLRYSTGRLWWRRQFSEFRVGFPYTHLSNYDVYKLIMSGAETLTPEVDQEADINIKVDRRNRRGVIGYTYKSSKWQWIYSWVLKRYSVQQIAGNMFHEYLHKQGFGHPFRNTIDRKYSVPYALGNYIANFDLGLLEG
jgi:hypothetical protein